MNKRTAENINTLAQFCGIRDIEELSSRALMTQYDIEKADVMVLIGGCVLAGADIFAKAIHDHIAKTFIIVGGAGHTTESFRLKVHEEYPFIQTTGLTEAEIFQTYLEKVYGYSADYLETKSTNCGNNITNLIALLKQNNIQYNSIILCQDSTMQRRIDAVWRKYADKELYDCETLSITPVNLSDNHNAMQYASAKKLINFAAYTTDVINNGNTLIYSEKIHGMWEMEHYISLLMSEIPRLTDDANGYGPNGKGFIAHVDVPDYVKNAFEGLKDEYGNLIR